MKKKSYEMNMSEGKLLPLIVSFAIPLMLSSFLQLLFNAADMVVAGRFVGSSALAAVGSTSALINLIINVFIGLSIGANVVLANYYGANKFKDVRETLHTSIMVAIIGGVFLGIIGFCFAKPLLEMMGSPEDVIDQSALYMKIYFLGMPATMLYNFGSAIFRAIGDTKRPLIFLTIAGVLNVFLNVGFVTVFKMGVDGVAWATIISQCVSTALIIITLLKTDGCFKLRFKRLKIHKDKLIEIMKIGLPAGLQGITFSISNVILQSSVNSLGSVAMAGCSADSNIENFVYTAMNAFYQTTISFTAQNYGAKQYKRMNKSLAINVCLTIITGLVMGWGAFFFGEELIGLYSKEADVIAFGLQRMSIVATTYFLCGLQEVFVGYLRGIGKSFVPMVISVFAICGVRILWVYTVFVQNRNVKVLFTAYPISWAVALVAMIICCIVYNKKLGLTELERNSSN